MNPSSYAPPLDRLLTLGEPAFPGKWPDYPTMNLSREHVPELIRMCTDEELNEADSESWAPVHAWRALGQLRAVEAIEPLIGLVRLIDEQEDCWIGEDFPLVFGMIGPAAIPFLDAYLNDAENGLFARVCAASGLEKIGNAHPEARAACVEALTAQLRKHAENDPTLNALLICSLVDIKAVKSVETMRIAYDADDVDESILGDMEDVEIELGLREKRSAPVRKRRWQVLPPTDWDRDDEDDDEDDEDEEEYDNEDEDEFDEDEEWIPSSPEEALGRGDYISSGSTQYRARPKVGRNDPCPCGSGKKYKKCCLNKP